MANFAYPSLGRIYKNNGVGHQYVIPFEIKCEQNIPWVGVGETIVKYYDIRYPDVAKSLILPWFNNTFSLIEE